MPRVLRTLLLWLFAASIIATPLSAATPMQEAPRSESGSRVTLALTSEPIRLVESQRAEGSFTTFDSALPLVGEAGSPALPTLTQLVGVPAGEAVPTIRLAAPELLPRLAQPVEPVPTVRAPLDGDATTRYLVDEALYAKAEWYPASPVTISQPMTLRDQIVVQITFTPVQVNLATGELRWYPSADVTLDYPDAPAATGASVSDPHFESTLAATLSNYEQARAWRSRPTASPTGGGGSNWLIQIEGTGVFRIPFTQLAAAGVPLDNLDRLMLFHGPNQTGQETQHAIHLDSEALYFVNTLPAPRWSNKTVYRLEVPPTGAGLRMAELDGTPNQPTTVTSVPYDLRVEEDRIYEPLETEVETVRPWYWKRLLVYPNPDIGDPIFETTFALPHLVAAHPTPATITAELAPTVASGCHSARVVVNSQQIGEQGTGCTGAGAWTGLDLFNQVMTLPHSALSATSNTFHIEQRYVGGDPDLLVHNAFTVRYQRSLVMEDRGLFFDDRARSNGTNFQIGSRSYVYLPLLMYEGGKDLQVSQSVVAAAPSGSGSRYLAFEVSTPAAPRIITGGTESATSFTFGRPNPSSERYLVTQRGHARGVESVTYNPDSGLYATSNQTEYLVIAPPAFANALQPLLAARGSAYSVRFVPTTQIYADFGTGVTDPAAIRAFLQYAYQNWAERPAYVLLVGDATYDPFDILGYGKPIWLPPYMTDKDPIIGEVPTDHSFVVALGAGENPNTDPLADMHLGRLPANSANEAQAMVQKILDYESAPAGDWQRSILLATDDAPDPAGDFYALSDSAAANFTPNILTTKAYLRQPGNSYPTELSVRDRIVSDLNQGRVIVQYIGHGSPTQWSASSGVWSVRRSVSGQITNDLDLLTANARLPLSLPWTCWEGYFSFPNNESLSEQMMRIPNKGAIASFAPTGQDVATGHDILTQNLYQALFDDQTPVTQLGPLIYASKAALAGHALERLLYTYMFYGDPALNLRIALP